MKKKTILKAEDISHKVNEIALKIVAKNPSMKELAIVGIRTCGAFLAVRIKEAINNLHILPPPVGILDITMYRDDWTRIGPTPVVGKTSLPFSIDGKTIILVDDVLFTGRTVRAAMDALMDYGRPNKIELAVLVDRGSQYRELPISANYIGGVWITSVDETINVYLKERGYDDHVEIEEKKVI